MQQEFRFNNWITENDFDAELVDILHQQRITSLGAILGLTERDIDKIFRGKPTGYASSFRFAKESLARKTGSSNNTASGISSVPTVFLPPPTPVLRRTEKFSSDVNTPQKQPRMSLMVSKEPKEKQPLKQEVRSMSNALLPLSPSSSSPNPSLTSFSSCPSMKREVVSVDGRQKRPPVPQKPATDVLALKIQELKCDKDDTSSSSIEYEEKQYDNENEYDDVALPATKKVTTFKQKLDGEIELKKFIKAPSAEGQMPINVPIRESDRQLYQQYEKELFTIDIDTSSSSIEYEEKQFDKENKYDDVALSATKKVINLEDDLLLYQQDEKLLLKLSSIKTSRSVAVEALTETLRRQLLWNELPEVISCGMSKTLDENQLLMVSKKPKEKQPLKQEVRSMSNALLPPSPRSSSPNPSLTSSFSCPSMKREVVSVDGQWKPIPVPRRRAADVLAFKIQELKCYKDDTSSSSIEYEEKQFDEENEFDDVALPAAKKVTAFKQKLEGVLGKMFEETKFIKAPSAEGPLPINIPIPESDDQLYQQYEKELFTIDIDTSSSSIEFEEKQFDKENEYDDVALPATKKVTAFKQKLEGVLGKMFEETKFIKAPSAEDPMPINIPIPESDDQLYQLYEKELFTIDIDTSSSSIEFEEKQFDKENEYDDVALSATKKVTTLEDDLLLYQQDEKLLLKFSSIKTSRSVVVEAPTETPRRQLLWNELPEVISCGMNKTLDEKQLLMVSKEPKEKQPLKQEVRSMSNALVPPSPRSSSPNPSLTSFSSCPSMKREVVSVDGQQKPPPIPRRPAADVLAFKIQELKCYKDDTSSSSIKYEEKQFDEENEFYNVALPATKKVTAFKQKLEGVLGKMFEEKKFIKAPSAEGPMPFNIPIPESDGQLYQQYEKELFAIDIDTSSSSIEYDEKQFDKENEYDDVALLATKKVTTLEDDFLLYQQYEKLLLKLSSMKTSHSVAVKAPTETLRRQLLWSELPEVISCGMSKTLDENQLKCKEALYEILVSQSSFVRSLTIVSRFFVNCPSLMGDMQLGSVINEQEKKSLFSNVDELKDINEKLLTQLHISLAKDVSMKDVPSIVVDHLTEYCKSYVQYCGNHVVQERTLTRLKSTNGNFKSVLLTLEGSSFCENLDLRSFLLAPVQRITRYPLLFESIKKYAHIQTADHRNAQHGLTVAEDVAKRCNEAVNKFQQIEQLVQLDSRLIYYEQKDSPKRLELVSSERWILKETSVIEVNGIKASDCRQLTVFLLTDLLLITRPNRNDNRLIVVDYCRRPFVEMSSIEAATLPNGYQVQMNEHLVSCTLLKNAFDKRKIYYFKFQTETHIVRWLEAYTPFQSNEDKAANRVYFPNDCPRYRFVVRHVAKQEDELNLQVRQTVDILQKMSDGFYLGET